MKRTRIAVNLALVVLLITAVAVYAGAALDFGQLTNTPSNANYVAWLGTAGTPPSQVLTEDGVQYTSGPDGGYDTTTQTWLISVANFNSPAAENGDGVNMLFGGLDSAAGSTWTYNFSWDDTAANTNHGTVGTQTSGSCPTMLAGSYNSTTGDKVISWNGNGSTYYNIYVSLNSSGIGNDRSNGRYNFVATVDTSGQTEPYEYTHNVGAATDSWHIVVPADASGNITGCHSEESSPTAVKLTEANAVSATEADGSNTMLLAVVIGLIVISTVSVVVLRRRPTS